MFDREADIIYYSSGTLLIGLISDTHIDYPSAALPYQVKDALRGVDLILHAGDIWIPLVLDDLESVAPVIAAWGDDDIEVDLGGDSRMMKGHSLLLGGITLWLTHIKPRYGLINPNEMLYTFSFGPSPENHVDPEDPPNVVVFGHTHAPSIEHYKVAAAEQYKNVLLVNPGSATFPNYEQRLGTIALLDINSGGVEVRIVPLQ